MTERTIRPARAAAVRPPQATTGGVAEEQAIYRALPTEGAARARSRAASVTAAARYVIATHGAALKNLERR